MQEKVLVGILLAVVCTATVIVHWPALSAKTVSFDDHEYLLENYLVQNPGWTSTKKFFTEVLNPSTVQGYYQPLTMVSLMLDYAMGGRPDNLRPFHITSLALHTANTALIIVLLYLLFGNIWPAAMAALLFGVHPLTVEPIPWLGERKTLLASFFALWCIIIYIRYVHKQNWKLCLGCAAAYISALLAKPTATPLPVLLLLLDYWPLQRFSKKTLLEKIPLFAVGTVSAVVTIISQGRSAVIEMPGEHRLAQIPLILCHNIVFYLHKTLWPISLTSHYPRPEPMSIANPAISAGIIGTIILLALLLISLRWTRAILTGWLFFFIAILPTMGIIGFTSVIASDKYAYFPLLGPLMMLASLLGRLWTGNPFSLIRRAIILSLIIAPATAESITTRYYLAYWQNTEKHLRYMFKIAPRSQELHNFAGCLLVRQNKPEQAASHFLEAIKIRPNYHRLYNNLGIAMVKLNRRDEAIVNFTKAVQLNADNDNAHYNLGLALAQKKDLGNALVHLKKALELKPDNPYTLINIAAVLIMSKDPYPGDYEHAVRMAKRACWLTGHKNPEMLNILAKAQKAADSKKN